MTIIERVTGGQRGEGSEQKWVQRLDHFSHSYWNPCIPNNGYDVGAQTIRIDGGSGFDAPGHSGGGQPRRKKAQVKVREHIYLLLWIAFCLTVITLAMVLFGAR